MNTSNAPATHPHQFRLLARRIAVVVALCALVATLTATWLTSSPASASPKAAPAAKPASKPPAPAAKDDDADSAEPKKAKAPKKSKAKAALAGKLNLNTATVEQLQLLPGVGQSKAERVVAWRQKNGGFKRVADLRKVKGFGYKTLKKLEPYLEIKGENSLAQK